MSNNHITAHILVKNEDQWVWFALQSILPYADHILVTDTGSTDKTIEIIKSISSPKIEFQTVYAKSSADITSIRTDQLNRTKTDWIWIVDGDEVYTDKLAKECLSAIKTDQYEGIVVRRYDLLGDIYQRQVESVGSYNLFGHTGHLVTRFVNKNKIPGLHYSGDYPLEGFYDKDNISTRDHNPKDWYLTSNYLYHAMYLKRSSLGSNLPMFNRGKYKIETGIEINDSLPEVFRLKYPSFVPNPLQSRGVGYEMLAKLITPIKKLKRKII